MCIIEEVKKLVGSTEYSALVDRMYEVKGDEVTSNNNTAIGPIRFYSCTSLRILDHAYNSNPAYIYAQKDIGLRLRSLFAQVKNTINNMWILTDNQSTIN